MNVNDRRNVLMSISIRNAQPQDLVQLLPLTKQINLQHYANAPRVFSEPNDHSSHQAFWGSKINQQQSQFLVAEHTLINTQMKILVGFIFATLATTPSAPFINPNSVCRINTLVVATSYQNQGIGTRLFQQIKAWAQEQGIDELRLEVMEFNQEAQHFYAKLGFKTQSRVLSAVMAK